MLISADLAMRLVVVWSIFERFSAFSPKCLDDDEDVVAVNPH
jgi:hypothetical protein